MAAFFLSIALMLVPQASATNQPTAAPNEGKCTVSGKVLSAANEAPLRGATVSMHKLGGNGDFSAQTDAAGRFEIMNVEPGKYWLVASHPGFLERYYGDHPESPQYLVISPGQTSADISFRLPPEATITGHVYDVDGKPIEHAMVQSLTTGYVKTRSTVLGDLSDYRPVTLLPSDSSKLSSDWWCKSTETDGDGKFVFVGIRPGDYRVFAWQKITLPEVRNPAFLARFEDEGQDVQVGTGAPFTLQLNAILARTEH